MTPAPVIDAPARNRQAWILRLRPALLGSAVKRLLGTRRVFARTPYGTMFIDPASNFGVAILDQGAYEPGMVALLGRTLGPGDTFVDAGANEGWFSVVASRLVGPAGRVLAIEPQGRLQPVLAQNFRANACANVVVAPLAVGAGDGELRLHLMPSINTGASSASRPTRYPLRTQRVRCTTLAALFRSEGIDRCDLLKVDVEGAEWDLLRGAEPLLTSGAIRRIALEYHPTILARNGSSVAGIHEWLLARGFHQASEPETALYVHTAAGEGP